MFFDDGYGLVRILVVAPLAYLGLVLMLRASGKRTLSKMNAFDFIVTVALGSVLASTIMTESVALLEGLLGMSLLVGLQYAITWLSVRNDGIARLVKDEPSLLLHQGRYLDSQLRKTRVTRTEIEAAVRESGKGDIDSIAAVILETDGSFSVIPTLPDDRSVPVGLQTPEIQAR